MSQNSLKRAEKKGTVRSYQHEEFGKVYIRWEKRTKRGDWKPYGSMRIR